MIEQATIETQDDRLELQKHVHEIYSTHVDNLKSAGIPVEEYKIAVETAIGGYRQALRQIQELRSSLSGHTQAKTRAGIIDLNYTNFTKKSGKNGKLQENTSNIPLPKSLDQVSSKQVQQGTETQGMANSMNILKVDGTFLKRQKCQQVIIQTVNSVRKFVPHPAGSEQHDGNNANLWQLLPQEKCRERDAQDSQHWMVIKMNNDPTCIPRDHSFLIPMGKECREKECPSSHIASVPCREIGRAHV